MLNTINVTSYFSMTILQALEDGNKIWGILKTGSNQDGRVSQPITAPSGEQQEELLRKVYSKYNVNPTTLQYIETHGITFNQL